MQKLVVAKNLFSLSCRASFVVAVLTIAVTMARSNPEVAKALGSPIRLGWFMQGTVQSSGLYGAAHLVTQLRGKYASQGDRGVVLCEAAKRYAS